MSLANMIVDSSVTPTLSTTAVIPVLDGAVTGTGNATAGMGTLSSLATFFAANAGPVVTTKVTINAAANANALVSTGYSLTGSDTTSMVDVSGTWNTSGVATAVQISVTDTASGSGSKLFDVRGGSSGNTTRFNVGRLGTTVATGTNNVATFQVTGGSHTGSGAAGTLVVTQTWNTSGAPTAISLAVTNTASDVAALLLNLLAGAAASTVAFQVRATGKVGIGKAATATSPLCISGLPTASAGLASGDVWSNAGVLTIV